MGHWPKLRVHNLSPDTQEIRMLFGAKYTWKCWDIPLSSFFAISILKIIWSLCSQLYWSCPQLVRCSARVSINTANFTICDVGCGMCLAPVLSLGMPASPWGKNSRASDLAWQMWMANGSALGPVVPKCQVVWGQFFQSYHQIQIPHVYSPGKIQAKVGARPTSPRQ